MLHEITDSCTFNFRAPDGIPQSFRRGTSQGGAKAYTYKLYGMPLYFASSALTRRALISIPVKTGSTIKSRKSGNEHLCKEPPWPQMSSSKIILKCYFVIESNSSFIRRCRLDRKHFIAFLGERETNCTGSSLLSINS